MSKRYVFWRDPSAKPYKADRSRHAPIELLSEIGQMAKVGPSGLQWEGFLHYRIEASLRATMAVVGPDRQELSDADISTIIRNAIRRVLTASGDRTPIQCEAFLRAADHESAAFFRRPPERFCVVSSLSVEALPTNVINIGGASIKAVTNRSRFPFPEHAEFCRTQLLAPMESYHDVAIHVDGRSHSDAFFKALRAVAMLRGLWTMFATYRGWGINMGFKPAEPMGVVHIGPLHTLHHPDGRLATEQFWYEADAFRERGLFTPKAGWPKIEKLRRWAQARIRRLPYRAELEHLLVRYATALDQYNLDATFLQLWSILESITATVGANYDETAKRTISTLDDRTIAKEVLHSLRVHRNRLVHHAASIQYRDQIAYLVKDFVDPHLARLIRNDFGIASLEEYGEHLAVSTDQAEVNRQYQKLRSVMRVRRARKQTSGK